jgi:hypothetical protein
MGSELSIVISISQSKRRLIDELPSGPKLNQELRQVFAGQYVVVNRAG